MRAEAASKLACRTDGDVLERLAAIDHRLNQISTHLTAIGPLYGQLDEIRANLQTLVGSFGSGPMQCTRHPAGSDG
jgi:hypothetical protein